jgi:NADH-quinone oxidoreductase subunit A
VSGYLPIVLFLGVVGAFVILSLVASTLLSPRRPNPAKRSPYECGIEPERLPVTERFPVKFYVVAMLFIIFDVEAIFLYPWAVALRQLGLFGLVEMTVFIGLVFVAYLYIWHKGGLEWEGPELPAQAAKPALSERPMAAAGSGRS